MALSTARLHAFKRLLAIEQQDAFSGFASDRAQDVRDERLAHEFVSGITRQKRWLDYLIDAFYSGSVDSLEAKLLVILRIGVYDILYMSTPDHAAVHEAVELAKKQVRPGAAKLANAVLRSLLRSQSNLPSPSIEHEVEYLGIVHSHPDWIVSRWLRRFGRTDTEALLAWNNRRPEYGIRLNATRVSREQFLEDLTALDLDYRAGRTDAFVYATGLSRLLASDQFKQGRMSVQDEAAGIVVQVLDPRPGEVVVDVCSAPGGKATYAAERMQNDGKIIAVDRHEGRLGLVKQGASRLGATIVETLCVDATKTLPVTDADKVLVDAPCSGLGVLAKRADLRWHMSEARIAELVDLQHAILNNAAAALRRGGVLVYSTCTTEPEENEEQIKRFLSENESFDLDPISAGGCVPDELVCADGFYRSLPHKHAMDGAFAARLVRNT